MDDIWYEKWTKGSIINLHRTTVSAYEINVINSTEYLFAEWKMGNYIYGGMEPIFMCLSAHKQFPLTYRHIYADGTANFFTEDIQKFQKAFFKNPKSEGLRDKFLRSRSGEIVIGYCSNDPEMYALMFPAGCCWQEVSCLISSARIKWCVNAV